MYAMVQCEDNGLIVRHVVLIRIYGFATDELVKSYGWIVLILTFTRNPAVRSFFGVGMQMLNEKGSGSVN